MIDPALWRLGAAELLDAYGQGLVTPRAVLEACLARIDATHATLNAFVALRADAARAEADASTQRWAAGKPVGALDGVPLAVKDNLPTADLPTTWGSAGMAGYRPARDELAVRRARAAGAVVVGKTNVPEFTLEGYTGNALHGTTRNPWDPRLTPGGSSGGSVAAVAAGCVPIALGTDGGGSTRRPASHTGLVGLKPSIGTVAREDALPPLLLDFEVVGSIARNVADTRLLHHAIRGPSAGDRRSLAAAHAAAELETTPVASAAQGSRPGRLRVLYVAHLEDAPVDRQIAASCQEAAQRLADLGHDVTEGPLPLDLQAINADWPRVGQMGLAATFEHRPQWRDGASARYVEMSRLGAALPASILWNLLESVEALRRDAASLYERLDLIVMPSAAALPWPADEPYPGTIDGKPVGPRGHAVFTGWVNAAGLPAIALPCAPSAEGLPIGVQLIGAYGSDESLLDLGAAFEALVQPTYRWPAV